MNKANRDIELSIQPVVARPEVRPLSTRLLNVARSLGYQAAQKAHHQYKEYTLPTGRTDFAGSVDLLTDEAMRRGAGQKPEELRWLLDVVAQNPPANVMEIGTCFGGTFFALAHLATENARLTSVDMPGGPFGGGYGNRGERRLESYVLPSQKFRAIKKDSHDPKTLEEVKDWLAGQPLDLLFIDGDHTKDGVQQDWEMYSPLVADDGIVAMHDITFHTKVPQCQVEEVWETVVKPGRRVSEFIDQPDNWGGIGLVHVKR